MTTLLDIGTTIRAERKRQKLFQKQVAEGSRVHRNTLADLEAGKGNVELNTLIAICDQLGLDIQLIPKQVSAMTGSDVQQSALSALLDEKLGVKPAKT